MCPAVFSGPRFPMMQDLRIPVPNGTVNVWNRPAEAGQPTVVLVHGLSGTSRWWTRVIDHLPDNVGVLALDVRGRGGSVDSPAPYDLSTIADDLARALDEVEVDQAIVVGYSMGAWIVSLFAEKHPDRVLRLFLVDGGFPMPMAPDASADEVIQAVVGPSLARLEVEFASEDSFFEYWATHPALERHWDEGMREALAFELAPSGQGRFAVRINPEAIRISAREITVDPSTNGAGQRVRVPTRLIVVERGTADQPGGMIPLDTARQAEATMPNLDVTYLEDLNHYTLVLGRGAPQVAAAIVSG